MLTLVFSHKIEFYTMNNPHTHTHVHSYIIYTDVYMYVSSEKRFPGMLEKM